MENSPYKELFYLLACSPRGSDEIVADFGWLECRMEEAQGVRWCLRAADLVLLIHPEMEFSFNPGAVQALVAHVGLFFILMCFSFIQEVSNGVGGRGNSLASFLSNIIFISCCSSSLGQKQQPKKCMGEGCLCKTFPSLEWNAVTRILRPVGSFKLPFAVRFWTFCPFFFNCGDGGDSELR